MKIKSISPSRNSRDNYSAQFFAPDAVMLFYMTCYCLRVQEAT